MKRIPQFVVTLLSVFILGSCVQFGASHPQATVYAFIPGECLKSTQLQTQLYNQNLLRTTLEHINESKHTFEFLLVLDLCGLDGIALHRIAPGGFAYEQALMPSDSLYRQFGVNSSRVRKAYKLVFDEIYESISGLGLQGPFFTPTTIYYCEGMVLSSSHDFNGIKAGENLAPIVSLYDPSFMNRQGLPLDYSVPSLKLPDHYQCLTRMFKVRIPLSEDDVIEDEDITFHIELPVKVGMFLTMLNDRLTDPDAEMLFRDEVLTCDLTIPHSAPLFPYPVN